MYAGDDRPLPEASDRAMRVMAEAGQRTLEDGMSALRPLFEGLPLPVREVALQMMQGFDPQHPAQVGELYVRHLRHPVLVQQTDANMIERIGTFCTDAFAAPAT
jgi:hypothetical protein